MIIASKATLIGLAVVKMLSKKEDYEAHDGAFLFTRFGECPPKKYLMKRTFH